MRVVALRSSIPWFGRALHRSFVPTESRDAIVHRTGFGPRGQRETLLSLAGTSIAAWWRSVGTSVRTVLPLALVLTMSDGAALADALSAKQAKVSRNAHAFAGFINEASRRFGVPVHWISAVLDAESAGDVCAQSPKSAMGLMQIMPKTWGELRLRYQLGNDPYDPHDNILAGTAYLHELHDRYGSPGFLAAYNAGPARFEQHLNGRRLPAETQRYVVKLERMIDSDNGASRLAANLQPLATSLFVALSEGLRTANSAQPGHMPTRASIAISAMVPQAPGPFGVRSMQEIDDEQSRKAACFGVLSREMGGRARAVQRHDSRTAR